MCAERTSTVPHLLSGLSKVFVLARLDRCGLCGGCGRVWFWALSKWSSVSGVRRTWGVFLHLSPVLQWPLVQPALWPLWPSPQSVPAKFNLPDTLQWNSLLQMPSWWVNTSLQPHTIRAFFSPLFECNYTILFNRSQNVDNLHRWKYFQNDKTNTKLYHISRRLSREDETYSCPRFPNFACISTLKCVRYSKKVSVSAAERCFLVHVLLKHLKTTVPVFLPGSFKVIKCSVFLTMMNSYSYWLGWISPHSKILGW